MCAISNRLERKLNRQLRTLAPEKSWLQSPSKWSEGELWKVKKIRLANPNLGMEENPGKKIEEGSNENWRGRGRQGGNKKNFPRGGRGRTRRFLLCLASLTLRVCQFQTGFYVQYPFVRLSSERIEVFCVSVPWLRREIQSWKCLLNKRLCARVNCITC